MRNVVLKNTQNYYKLDTGIVKKQSMAVMEKLKLTKWEVTIWFTTDRTVKAYNKDFRDVDAPTDVLSLPACKVSRAGDSKNYLQV